MKKAAILSLATLAMTLSLMFGGCGAPPEAEEYRQVSVGRMSVDIPADWERTQKFDRYIAAFASGEYATALKADQYFDTHSGDAFLMIITLDMRRFSQSTGAPWKGWEEIWRYFPQEQYVTMTHSSILPELSNLTRVSHSQLNIDGYNAWESQFAGKITFEPKRACIVVTFYDDDLAVLFMLADEADWHKYEATWHRIRDSLDLTP